MQNCNHDEPDTGIVVNVMHALQQGAKTIQVNTGAVVSLAGAFHNHKATQTFADILVVFGMGKNDRFYHIICSSLLSQDYDQYLCFTHLWLR